MGRISELVNQMIQKILESSEWTSANPTHINTFIQANAIDSPDFEKEIESLIKSGGGKGGKAEKVKGDEGAKNDKKKLDNIKVKQDQLLKGNIGKFQKFTSEQFGNISGVASNPLGFIFGKIGTKLVRGGVILGLILLVEQIVGFVISESMKPGRWLDRRLKIAIDEQVLLFTRRKELAELRQGFKTVFVTASPFIRGQAGVIGSNLLFDHGGIPKTFNNKPQVIDTVGNRTSNTNKPGGTRK